VRSVTKSQSPEGRRRSQPYVVEDTWQEIHKFGGLTLQKEIGIGGEYLDFQIQRNAWRKSVNFG
jgi:hypothetical protein